MMSTNTAILFVLLIVVENYATNYCSKSICPNGGPHIGCNNNNKFYPTCNSPKIVPFGSSEIDIVLNYHNEKRNKVASGGTQFSSAVRMPRLKWNNELAKLAHYNVLQCTLKHDKCRNTDSFAYAGQNLGYYSTTASLNQNIIKSYIIKVQDSWYSENDNMMPAWIDSYPLNTNGKVIGHFTAMIQDHTSDVGCACATYKMKSGSYLFNTILLACNYGYTNIIKYPVFVKGPAASKCTTGRDTNYTSLCSLNEIIPPTPT